MFFVLYFVEIVNGTTIATARHAIFTYGGQHHSLPETFLKATVLTTIALLLGDDALLVGYAIVNALILYGAFEKSFAPFTRDDAVVKSGGFVLTDHTDHVGVWRSTTVGNNGTTRAHRQCCGCVQITQMTKTGRTKTISIAGGGQLGQLVVQFSLLGKSTVSVRNWRMEGRMGR